MQNMYLEIVQLNEVNTRHQIEMQDINVET